MPRPSALFAMTAALAASVSLPAHADMMFNRIASFAVADNLPADIDGNTETSSEIIAASEDGTMLAYSDSPLGAVGFVDITDPRTPKAGGIVRIDGEPTSVTIVGGKVLAGVNTSKSYTEPSGNLAVIDIASKAIESSCDLGGQPDSVAVSKDGNFLAVAIENERDEDLNDGEIPQLPAGDLKIFTLTDGVPDCATMKTVVMTGLAEIAGDDPEPEFVAFNDAGEIAVTLQENNHVAIVDAATGSIVSHFSAGSVSLDKVDTKKDGAIAFTGKVDNAPREPDAVKWLDNDRIVIANEGDYKGGTRGFSIFSKTGQMLFDSGTAYEYEAAKVGHFPDARAGKKGIEPEGLETGRFGDDSLFFVTAERASLIAVYKDAGAEPQFLQLLPSGVAPEGLVAIPSRNLLVTANEADLAEDGGARSHVMIYERADGPASYPMITSGLTDDGTPLGWGALSGLAADPEEAGKLYAVSDSFYKNSPAIFTIDTTQTPALITARTVVTRDGAPAQKLDLEGIAADGKGGFWLASEGRTDKLTPHAILHVDAKGAIRDEIGFPDELMANEIRFGLEGITTVGEGDDMMLVMAVQREWRDDPKGQVKLLAYTPKAKEWSAVRYPLEKAETGWMGLSEITAHDGKLYIVERDNLIGQAARVKRVYAVSLDGFKPEKLGGELPVVAKALVHDLMDDLKATGGYVVDKVEGFAIDKNGDAYAVTDNDGVDDSSGETLFLRLGNISAIN
ncbi:MAG: esterase-like activity of phytase family protein [Alphaproteobacteria bacterium]|nr:esterase-like activity of phytase family protein [Alphaproteobacteria bacterium]MBU0805211.1 esterase-like activity of phytase family protein [Alphaproteobacteria bacterium]MBU0870710.1 esterase-like activity of phytase family protein [Alphaproteobacteria bacterium]MBU1401615.1 esterase-like activity of phytase family protein [Alphaproteobacteria bacterium]MBU1591968.1 esterase-like activity of phytase family protein [Alphaproteobacteria bacterium]